MQQTTQKVSPGLSTKQTLMRELPKSKSEYPTIRLVIVAFLVVVAGLGSGWLLSGIGASETDSSKTSMGVDIKKSSDEAGLSDESLFEEEAPEGLLVEGGIEGEGTHYLDRGLGPEKNVYLTSTLLDLQSFVGKKVRVWGNTIAAQNAPWLMDVGKLKVIE